MDTRWLRNSFVYLVIMVAVLAIFFTLVNPAPKQTEIPITELLATIQRDAKNNRIDTITMNGNTLVADTSEGKKTAIKPDESDILDMLAAPRPGTAAVYSGWGLVATPILPGLPPLSPPVLPPASPL